MGLDMYLYAEKYESKYNWVGERNLTESERKQVVDEFYPEDLRELGYINLKHNFLSKETKYQIGYWRKFNALQGWFIKKFTADETGHGIYLYKEDVDDLIDILQQVKDDLDKCKVKVNNEKVGETWENGIKSDIIEEVETYDSDIARRLLPTTKGFFYGSQLYDDWYKEDIEYSLELFKEARKLMDLDYEIVYRASW